jgi:heavy metal translocating P-type ATPase
MKTAPASCDFCGLPVPGVPAAAEDRGGATPPQFCCIGCRFASTVTRERGETGAIRWTMTRLGLSIFLSMNVMAFSMALWTVDVYGEDETRALATPLFGLFRYLCLLFSFPVLILLGGPLLDSAWQGLRHRRLSTDLLLLIGTAAAFILSAHSVFREQGPIYFEVSCVILVMVTLGRWFEAAGKQRAGAALDDLQRLLPEFVRVIRDGSELQVATAQVARGDRLRILPGERFPTDGRLVEGRATVDEQILTGESQPVLRGLGDTVLAGTLNLDGAVVVTATSNPGGGTLDRLISAVKQARETKGYYQTLADRISSWVFPAVATIAVSTFGWHWMNSGIDRGVTAGLAVVLVSCPCALGLATPLAAWTALGASARKQVLFKSGQALERLASVRAIRFDKTGTLTSGAVRVVRFIPRDGIDSFNVNCLLKQVNGLTAVSLHPFARAVHAFAAERSAAAEMADVRERAGRGLSGRDCVTGDTVSLGSLAFMQESHLTVPESLASVLMHGDENGRSLVCVGWRGEVRAVFQLEEALRPGAIAAVEGGRRLGLDVGVLTGDHHGCGQRLAAQLGAAVQAGLMPEEKLVAIRDTQRRIGPVAMVGDGINDAPALAASDAGVALGCGADVSRDAALVCLLSNDPEGLIWAIAFARQVVRVMRRNLLWAFTYNCVGVALAASGRLNPALAALLMVVSSVLVVRSALSLADVAGESPSIASPSDATKPPIVSEFPSPQVQT